MDAGVLVDLTTNGGRLAALRQSLRSWPIRRLAVSLDSHDREIAEQLRPGVTFDDVLLGLQAARADLTGIRIELWTTVTRLNVDSLSGLVTLAARLGCQAVVAQPLAGTRPDLLPDPGHLSVALQDAMAAARKVRIEFDGRRFKPAAARKCHFPASSAMVRLDDQGFIEVLPCCNWDARYPPVRVPAQSFDLAIAWSSDEMGFIRDELGADRWPSGCNACSRSRE